MLLVLMPKDYGLNGCMFVCGAEDVILESEGEKLNFRVPPSPSYCFSKCKVSARGTLRPGCKIHGQGFMKVSVKSWVVKNSTFNEDATPGEDRKLCCVRKEC